MAKTWSWRGPVSPAAWPVPPVSRRRTHRIIHARAPQASRIVGRGRRIHSRIPASPWRRGGRHHPMLPTSRWRSHARSLAWAKWRRIGPQGPVAWMAGARELSKGRMNHSRRRGRIKALPMRAGIWRWPKARTVARACWRCGPLRPASIAAAIAIIIGPPIASVHLGFDDYRIGLRVLVGGRLRRDHRSNDVACGGIGPGAGITGFRRATQRFSAGIWNAWSWLRWLAAAGSLAPGKLAIQLAGVALRRIPGWSLAWILLLGAKFPAGPLELFFRPQKIGLSLVYRPCSIRGQSGGGDAGRQGDNCHYGESARQTRPCRKRD